MQSFRFSSNKVRNIWIVGIVLFIVTIGFMISCGKLKDAGGPSSPVGTSGGVPLPIGRQSSIGTYTLSLYADPSTIPADLITFSTLHAKLEDTSGRSVENFTIEFESELGYLTNDPQGPTTWAQTAKGVTSQWGTVSLYLYGNRAGSEQVQAKVDLDRDGVPDLFTTTLVIFTPGPGVPGSGVPGVRLTVDQTAVIADAGVCDNPILGTGTFVLTATVWETTGDLAGSGVRVELSGDVSPNLVTWGDTDSKGQVSWTYTYTRAVGTYTFTVIATVVIGGVTYTDSVTYSLVVQCTVPTPTPSPTSVPTATPIPTPTPVKTFIVSAEKNMIGCDEQIYIRAIAKSDGQPDSNLQINFTILNGPVFFVGPSSAVTDASGQAEVDIQGNNCASTGSSQATINATTTDGRNGSVTITVKNTP
jgi:hypothetical protein